ncbi:IclR family transcriptional regulator domain-containing protein [Microbacterium marinilacus]|uniref:IclR family transcriptional regulator C-terminal domain-containing protein n=1 Tax=Microbacterium marinilacus TaxID=415209 RepID=A0ABP7BWM0_9MICO|nr:IclR family transcriptional regulator C-terminal domain-containing protein [Microbacterium marinilacus]MBY0688170.1 helix-turn-helix domain-containing protein [Microbacterium marinilacus]
MTEADPTDAGSREYVQSFARGLAVIRAFDAEHPRLTLSEVAVRAGLTRAAARRFLLTLEQLGYVRSAGRDFALTPRVLELGFSYLSALSLPELAQPHLERLSREVDESVSAAVLDGDDIVYVARVPTRRIMSVGITIGTRFPARRTSMGRVLLAGLPAADRPARDAALGAELDEVAAQGWAIVDAGLEPGLRSVAAPLHGRDGRVVAAVNVSTTAGRVTLERLREVHLPVLLRTAAAIDAELRLV